MKTSNSISDIPLLKEFPSLLRLQEIVRWKNAKIYLVGGFLRDRWLGRLSLDLDFAVNKGAVDVARAFSRAIKGAFIVLDKENGCARVVKKKGDTSLIFDFADFRARTLSGDLSHRDFTINTLVADLMKFQENTKWQDVVLDKKKAAEDLKSRTIRMTSKNVFREDPLRMMRAFSIKASLGFKIEKSALNTIKEESRLLQTVSAERVREELFKIMETPDAAATIREMDKIGLFDYVIPQVNVMRGCVQGGYHHLDVWRHSLEAVAQIETVLRDLGKDSDTLSYVKERVSGNHSRLAVIRLATLLHDIGKPAVRKKEAGRNIFHGHEHVGKTIVRHIGRQLKLSTDERYMLENMVELHLRPGYLANFRRPTERAVYRFFRSAKGEAVSVLILSLADQRATRGPETTLADLVHHEKVCRDTLKRYWIMKKKVPVKRLLTGDDIIQELKISPSPLFAVILSAVDEMQALRKIGSREEAIEVAKNIIKKEKAK